MNSDKKNIQAGIKSFFGPKTRTYLEAAQKALNKTPPNENNVQVTAVKHAEGGFEEVKNSEDIEKDVKESSASVVCDNHNESDSAASVQSSVLNDEVSYEEIKESTVLKWKKIFPWLDFNIVDSFNKFQKCQDSEMQSIL